jgi:hypothetical protein
VPIYSVSATANRKATVAKLGGVLMSGICGLRLTTESGVPVSTSDRTAQGTVYFTFHAGNQIVLYDGTRDSVYLLSAELSCPLNDNLKSPAAVASGSNYDLFVWDDAGTVRLGRGPAWSSDTSRGTGAGTTELEYRNGRLVNKVAITNGPGAQRGTYVGTIRGSAANQTEDGPRMFVWNMYNQVSKTLTRKETTDTWTYTTLTWRAANNSTANRVEFVRGLNHSSMRAWCYASANSSTTKAVSVGIALDATNTSHAQTMGGAVDAGEYGNLAARWHGYPGLGYHYLQWTEISEASGTTTWVGDGTHPDYWQGGLLAEGMF